MKNIDVVAILQYGVIGLGFLLALLSYHLLRKEQAHEPPRRPIINAIYAFMSFSVILCLVGLLSERLSEILGTKSAIPHIQIVSGLQKQIEDGRLEIENLTKKNADLNMQIRQLDSDLNSARDKARRIEQNFKGFLQGKIDNKKFAYHQDDTTTASAMNHKSGNEFFVDGKTGLSSIAVRENAADVTLPYSAHYKCKNFIGMFSEYRTEKKDVSGKYLFRVTMWSPNVSVEELGMTDLRGVKDENHDAQQKTKSGIIEDIVNSLRRP